MAHEHHDHDEHDHHDHEHDHEIHPRHFFGAVPVFLVDDIEQTVSYYRDVLGFEVDFLFGGPPPTYASVSRDDAILNFTTADPPGSRNSIKSSGSERGVDTYVVVSDVDEVYEEVSERGANIVVPITSFDYGMREFAVEDINGYRLSIAEETDDV